MTRTMTKITYLLLGVLFIAVVAVNIKSNALEFGDLKDKLSDENKAETVAFVEYDVADEAYIDIESISLEQAVADSYYETEDSVVEDTVEHYEASGTVTVITPDETDNNNESDSSSLYYLGSSSDANDEVLVGTASDAEADYYVENWRELEGDLSIKVNKQASCVTVYKGEVPIRAMVCSAGETTPEGTFYMELQWDWLKLIENQYGRYCSQISGDYLFHSVPYNAVDFYSLDTQMYNQLGTLCSHGCIRLTVEDAKWIYDNCKAGTEIVIYNDDNPGPMGKPGFEKIPETQTWDPTDIEVQ